MCYSKKILVFFLILARPTQAQEFIILNDSLVLNSDRLDVSMGSIAMEKIKNFGFGDYVMISSKVKSSGSERSNLFGTKSESKTTKNLAFVLSNGNGTVSVDAEFIMIERSQNQIEVTPGLLVGTDQSLGESNSLLAVITMPGDSSTGWRLIFGTLRNRKGDNPKYEMVLTNGERDILLTLATSNKDFDFSKPYWFMGKIPAMGFEFKEIDRPLGAVQHIGGGSMMAAMNQKWCKVWISRKTDPKMKLVLAGAMTTILLMQSPASPFH